MPKRTLIFAAAALLALSLTATAEPTTWNLDQAHSQVGFSVRHFLTPVSGRFDDFSGTIVYDPETPSNSTVEVTVQAASIDTRNENRDNHLRSGDFFDVEKHPTLSFKSKKVAKLGDNLAVTGDLTMHGVTKEVTIPIQVLGMMGPKAGFSTEFVVDRQEYGISWNRALDQGGTMLSDEVKVSLTFEANKQEPETAEGQAE
jgi:polyisoprenoid-binding protein YceI